jgi:hypothetical protein
VVVSAPGADVEQKLHFGWAFADSRHHLLVLQVDWKLRSRECSARPLGIIDFAGHKRGRGRSLP